MARSIWKGAIAFGLVCRPGTPRPQPKIKAEFETPGYVSPQLAQVVANVPRGSDVIHELKYDGCRLVIVKHQAVLTAYTRNGQDWTDKFKSLAKHLTEVSGKDFILDGEAVVWDEKGHSNFGDLQAALKGRPDAISFVAFDLLHFDGNNLRGLPLAERQKRLAELISEEPGVVRRSTVWPSDMGTTLRLLHPRHPRGGASFKRFAKPVSFAM